MKALILGYGRAGKRHAKLLQQRGIEVDVYDPAGHSTVDSNSPQGYDFCVIASPPLAHLHQLRNCMVHDVPVLIEKPLCGFFEGFADVVHYKKASICFNYRYHPAVVALKETPLRSTDYRKWIFYSCQHRAELPAWGLLLDHLPHTFDMLLHLNGPEEFDPTYVSVSPSSVFLSGKVAGEEVDIIDEVSPYPMVKDAFILCPYGYTPIENDTTMFDLMYEDFLAGNYTGLNDAARVQDWLNKSKLMYERRRVAV